MDILYTLTLAIIFSVACAYVSMQLQHHIMPRLIWCFIMVPVLALYWFPTWMFIFWLSFTIQTIFGKGTLDVYEMSAFQRRYGGICDTVSAFLFGGAILNFIFYLFR